MPRGKYVNHKGRNRNFTSEDELEQERKNDEAKKKWREENGVESDSDEEIEEAEEESDEEGSLSGESEDSDDDKKKGVAGIIQIENPNRVQKKATVKASGIDVNAAAKPELSRREREQIEKQKAQASYMKRHAEGKTDQAKADLARLAIIKQHRAEAAARREQEKKEKEGSKKKSSN